jgi:hypothetical protein
MKCLKNVSTGNIIRVDDKQAYQMSGNTWKYVSKEEWKRQNSKTVEQITEETPVGLTLKEKKKKISKKVQ